jgi:Coenzyme PQQ synthesis protein D (PqqD)
VSGQAQSSNPAVVCDADDCAPASMMRDGRLACIKGQNLLFSPSQKAIFSLNETAAEIWRCLEDGMAPREIAAEIAGHGVEPSNAYAYVEAALADWEQVGVLRPCLPSSARYGQVATVVGLAGLSVGILYPPPIAEWAEAAFRHLEIAGGIAEIQLQIVERGDRVQLFRNGEWLLSCTAAELPTALKGQLLAEVLSNASYELALHCACLLNGGRALLLCGNPGAGKTTLAMALVHAGFAFAGDDVALLDSNGQSIGLPFAPAVKPGAWPILAPYCPELLAAPVFRRPDGIPVRYPTPGEPARCCPQRVGWVVLLDRQAGTDARLEPIDAAGALRGLLDGAFASGGELSASAFEVLARVIGSAQSWRLTYSRLEDAVMLLGPACR